METIGYALLGIVAVCWLAAMLLGMIAAFPVGLLGLVAIFGIGILFLKVVRERLQNKEDDYYSKHVDK
ncbi:MAG: hypothetical protein J7M29_12365 [Verrucomicrobia bacterium]|nr:hypothetical protein [Verrucomicrobiota bacterium]